MISKLNKYYVYALVCPINNIPFYIGKGCGDRANSHLKYQDNSKKSKYISKLRFLGFEPIVKYIDCDMYEKDAYEFELYCMKEVVKFFPHLTNVVGIKMPPSRKGIKWSKDSILKRSNTVRSKHLNGYKRPPMTEEQKSKISASLKGIPNKNKVHINVDELKRLYRFKLYQEYDYESF